MFDTHEWNRPLHDDPVLLASFKKYGFMPSGAIHVTRNGKDKLKVKRGHHRLHYAKMLGLPVYFIIDDTPISIFEGERTKQKWSVPDFVVAQAKSGDKECAFVLQFQKAHGLPMGVAIALVSGRINEGGPTIRQIEQGSFHRGDMKIANLVVEITDYCYARGIAHSRSKAFVWALTMMLNVPQFDRAVFLHKIDTAGAKLGKRSTYKEYLEEIEALYYYGARVSNRVDLVLRAKQTAHEKARTFGGKTNAVKAA